MELPAPAGPAAPPAALGPWLKARRKALDLTQTELARQTGCTESTIRKVEAGRLRPSRQIAGLLAAALHVPPAAQDGWIQWARAAAEPGYRPPDPTRRPGGVATGYLLPVPPTPLIGRAHEVAGIRSLLAEAGVRLVTLTGPPGTGKTRLALEVARAARDRFPDGVCFVALAPISDPALVLPAIADTLEIAGHDGPTLLARLIAFLRDRALLLVLDNFEQVVPAAPGVAAILEAAAGVQVLVTSREELRLRGERIFPVPPLALPAGGTLPLERLAAEPAVALFVARARDSHPGFGLTAANADDVVAICRAVDGLPLALELAAGRLGVLSPADLRARLTPRLLLLTGGPRDLPPHQQTLTAAITWSYDLLTPAEQAALRQLAVFAGSCALAAAEAVIRLPDNPDGAPGAALVLDLLESLRRKSLVYEVAGSENPRIALLELIREFAGDRLRAWDDEAAARQRHWAYFLTLAEEEAAHLTGPEQPARLARLEEEHANLRAALGWALGAPDIVAAARLALALGPFWHYQAHWAEGRYWLDAVLARIDAGAAVPPGGRGRLLHQLGVLTYRQGDLVSARGVLEASIALLRQAGDGHVLAAALADRGTVAMVQDEYEPAIMLLEESLTLAREAGDGPGVARALGLLGFLDVALGHYARATVRLEEARDLAADAGDTRHLAWTYQHLGRVARYGGAWDRATGLLATSLAAHRVLGNRAGEAAVLLDQSMLALGQGAYQHAAQLAGESRALFQSLGSSGEAAFAAGVLGMVAAYAGDVPAAATYARASLVVLQGQNMRYDAGLGLVALAHAAAREGCAPRAAQLAAAATALYDGLGVVRDPILDHLLDQAGRLAQAALKDAAWQEAWQAGYRLSFAQACRLALQP
ncbi:MAG TPA: tetratricopeptide repeat protein [Chloroflexia bacterium]|nr:tetratricopeptide repeat protein [Chloroflexia bacterium]